MRWLVFAALLLPSVFLAVSARAAQSDMTLQGTGFSVESLSDGARAFGNRDYVWRGVPEALHGW